MSTNTGPPKEIPEPNWAQLMRVEHELPASWGGLSDRAAFDEVTSNDGSSTNQNCMVKWDENKTVAVVITGIEEQWVQVWNYTSYGRTC